MLDFLIAMMAAGINSMGDEGPGDVAAVAPPTPAPVAAPETTEPEVAEATPQPVPESDGNASVVMGDNVSVGTGVVVGGASLLAGTSETQIAAAPEPTTAPALDASAAQSQFNMAVVPAGLVAEPQTPSGKFTTAAEVKPILNATKGNWVAVREYDGKDLLYVTHLWGWRCGLAAMAISVNDEPMQNWPLPPCHMKYTTPNAILEEDGLPYLSLRLGAVRSITIQIVYDDLSMDIAQFERGNVLIP